MGSTADSWTVTGAITSAATVTAGTGVTSTTGSVTATAGHLYANGGDLVARDYIRTGVTGGYLTDGNYNWMHSDGNGIKAHMFALMDLGGSSFYRLYVQNGNVRAMPV